MFDYPNHPPARSEYHDLGVGPEADSDEIREARREVIDEIATRRGLIQQRLEAVLARVDGLREALQRVEELGLRADADPEELRLATLRYSELRRQALALAPDFDDWREELRTLEKRERAINRMKILKAGRAAYDQENPPFELLKLAKCTRHDFVVVPPLLVALIRRDLTGFLSQQGETVFHPSDLTREDFTRDFEPNRYLDGGER